VPSSITARGMVADVHLHRSAVRSRPDKLKPKVVAAATLGFMAVLLCQLAGAAPEEGPATAQETEQSFRTYEFAVYSLNHTSRISNGVTTVFTFDSNQLPFDFGSLRFDEAGAAADFSPRYYVGMSLLAWAYGPDSVIGFLESGVKPIEDIEYLGQSPVVLNGWESMSKDSHGGVIDHTWGSMQIVAYDWRDGCWSPEQGIAVEHPEGVTVSGVTICLMVYEPNDTADIPELGPVAAVIALCLVVLVIKKAGGRRPKPRPVQGQPKRL